MPVYLYRCSCGHTEEQLHSVKEDPQFVCPHCGEDLKRRPSLAGVSFAGDGWAAKE